ncbi:MAG: cytochrome PufQ [Pseudomonadota bacterium]
MQPAALRATLAAAPRPRTEQATACPATHPPREMNRTEFVVATAIILLVAFSLGWFASWLLHRLTRVTEADIGELDRMAQALHEAEELRDQAMTYIEDREAELVNRLTQTEAELRAAMEGLRDARAEAEDLRAYIEKASAG